MGGAGGAPPPISLSILYEKNKKYIQKHTKNMQIHINTRKDVEKYMKNNFTGLPTGLGGVASSTLTGGGSVDEDGMCAAVSHLDADV